MPVVAVQPKVLLTSALTDVDLAERVGAVLQATGIEVLRTNHMQAGQQISTYLRRSIQESAAIVVVISRATTDDRLPASLLFEIGAAFGAGKRVFVVLEDPSRRLDFSVPNMHILPISRVDEVKQALAGIAA